MSAGCHRVYEYRRDGETRPVVGSPEMISLEIWKTGLEGYSATRAETALRAGDLEEVNGLLTGVGTVTEAPR